MTMYDSVWFSMTRPPLKGVLRSFCKPPLSKNENKHTRKEKSHAKNEDRLIKINADLTKNEEIPHIKTSLRIFSKTLK